MELLIIVIVALALLAIAKGGIEININHTHIHKNEDLPVDNEKDKYNESYGDPGVIDYFDKMHKGE